MLEQSDPQTDALIAAAREVYRILGHGFDAAVYQEALTVEFGLRNIPFVRDVPLSVMYRGEVLSCQFRADFVCYASVIVDVKAMSQVSAAEDAEVINLLKVSRLPTGLLLNFTAGNLQHKRFVLSKDLTTTQH